VHLAPGETRRVTIDVEPRRMDYWSEKAKGWKVVSGARTVLVGRSEQDLPLTQVVK
jgi:beta-glucosidase